MQDILSIRVKEHASEDAEQLLLRYQVVQRAMEKNSANLTDEWYIDLQRTLELEKAQFLPPHEMDDVWNLWNYCMGPSRSKLQALSVVIDPRIWDLERQRLVKLDDKVIKRAEIVYDELVNKIVEDEKRSSVNKTWYAFKLARNTRLNPGGAGGAGDIFNNVVKITRSSIIGPWKWWSTYAGSSNADFVQDIARVVLNIRCNASATERVNSMYKHVIGLARVRMNNDRAEKLVYVYVT